jgi:dephospho-CoA kinase
MTRTKKIIGVTGSTGSGKSTVAALLDERGGYIIDADALSHDVLQNAARGAVVGAFGEGILDGEQRIDRKKLGSLVFADEKKREALEQIVHPLVREGILEHIERAQTDGCAFIVIDAVLLIETGLDALCDDVWLVAADEKTRLGRIIARDSLTEEAAWARMRNQRDTETLLPRADRVIRNDGGLAALREQVFSAIGSL